MIGVSDVLSGVYVSFWRAVSTNLLFSFIGLQLYCFRFTLYVLSIGVFFFLMQQALLFNKKAKKNPYFTLPVQHQMENENENDRNVRQVQAGDKIGTPALVHGKPHADRFHVNRFRHANLLPRLTASCYM